MVQAGAGQAATGEGSTGISPIFSGITIGDLAIHYSDEESQGDRPDLGRIGNSIRDQVESPIEKDLFEHYWLGRGTNVELTKEQFGRVVDVVSGLPQPDAEAVSLGDHTLLRRQFGFPARGVRCGVRHSERLLQPGRKSRRLLRPIQLRHTLAWQPGTDRKSHWCSRSLRCRRELRALRHHVWPICQAIARAR